MVSLAEVGNNNDVALNAIVDALNAEVGLPTQPLALALLAPMSSPLRCFISSPQGGVVVLADGAFTDSNSTGLQLAWIWYQRRYLESPL